MLKTALTSSGLLLAALVAVADTPPNTYDDGQATYFVVPLHGTVGTHIVAPVVEQSLQYAVSAKPDVLVLEIDSGGGVVSEKVKIVDLILNWKAKHSETRLVAVIKNKAFSAGAILALPCDEIYMITGSAIGATLAVAKDNLGRTFALHSSEVGEKYASTIRAKDRAAAEAGGHNTLLVDAMSDAAIALRLGSRGQIEEVTADADDNEMKDIIVRRGQLLVLSTEEAVGCGLARAVVDDYDNLCIHLGYSSCQESNTTGRHIADRHARRVERTNKKWNSLVSKYHAEVHSRGRTEYHRWRRIVGLLNHMVKLCKKHSWLANVANMEKISIERDKAVAQRNASSRNRGFGRRRTVHSKKQTLRLGHVGTNSPRREGRRNPSRVNSRGPKRIGIGSVVNRPLKSRSTTRDDRNNTKNEKKNKKRKNEK